MNEAWAGKGRSNADTITRKRALIFIGNSLRQLETSKANHTLLTVLLVTQLKAISYKASIP
ncbi:MAG: hypothetical protein EBW16_08390 [Burkholderiaceae bacterium]|nr:hypothetical protein [Burkholderiaceae bacterium]